MPPGLLALDNMLYFSRHAPSAYSRVSNRMGHRGWHQPRCIRTSMEILLPFSIPTALVRVGEQQPRGQA